ncbi:MAG: hypothetical protein IJT31_01155, partial [Oscillibacter sp.]|nr:hypothetical protein [Oscillibacter sp.]
CGKFGEMKIKFIYTLLSEVFVCVKAPSVASRRHLPHSVGATFADLLTGKYAAISRKKSDFLPPPPCGGGVA